MALPEDLKDVLESEVAKLDLERHPFFTALLTGTMPKESFIDSQIQIAFLVRSFAAPMAAIAAGIPGDDMRLSVVENLWEQYGKGKPEKIHGRSLLALIERLGGDLAIMEDMQASAPIAGFNVSIKAIASYEDYQVSTAVFAGIERVYTETSSLIFRAIVAQGWLAAQDIAHYRLHTAAYDENAEAFLRLVGDDWILDGDSRALIKNGIKLGAALFARVYTNLTCEQAYF